MRLKCQGDPAGDVLRLTREETDFFPREKNWLVGLEGLDQGGQEIRPDEQEFVDLGVTSWGVGLSTLAKTPAGSAHLLLGWCVGPGERDRYG